MAYVSQELKAKLAPTIKAVLKKYNMKGTLSVNHHSTLVLTIKSGVLDFGQDAHRGHIDVNVYWLDDHYTGKAKDFLKEVYEAMKGPDFFDHSDIQSDYFHRSHYIDINVGRWDKPYVMEA